MSYINRHNLPQRGFRYVTPPSERSYLVSLDQAKEHLRIGHSSDDSYITQLIKVAQMMCEEHTGQFFTAVVMEYYADNWQQTKEIPNYSTVRSITSIEYYDQDDVLQTFASSNYYLENATKRSRIALKDNVDYPDLRDGIGNIKITLTFNIMNYAGGESYTFMAYQAMLITIADLYENRQSVIVGRIASVIPKTAEYILNKIKIQNL